MDTALDTLAAPIEPIETYLSWRPQLNNPDDEMVLEAAINGHTDAFVTYDPGAFPDCRGELRGAFGASG